MDVCLHVHTYSGTQTHKTLAKHGSKKDLNAVSLCTKKNKEN